MSSSPSPSEALRARQHRTAAQRLVRRAFFEMSQARIAWTAASFSGRDAAAALVNAHLSATYAAEAQLPPSVAAQPGLAAAVARKLAQRAAAAAAALRDAVAALRSSHEALDAALRSLSPTETHDGAGSAPDASDAATPPAASRAGSVVPPRFDPHAFPDMVIYAALPLAALGVLRDGVLVSRVRELADELRCARAAQTHTPPKWLACTRPSSR